MRSEKLFHITPRFFSLIFDLFKKKMQEYTNSWSLDSNGTVKHRDLVALNEFSLTIESIIDCIPEKWNRQAFDLIVNSEIGDFVIGTCLAVVKDQDLIDYDRIILIQDSKTEEPEDVRKFVICDLTSIQGNILTENGVYSQKSSKKDNILNDEIRLTIISTESDDEDTFREKADNGGAEGRKNPKTMNYGYTAQGGVRLPLVKIHMSIPKTNFLRFPKLQMKDTLSATSI